MTGQSTFWKNWFHKAVPSRETLAAHPWLRSALGRLREPQLWRLQHEAVARGVAIGTFWAFALPFAQIVVTTAHCIRWRANIPVAAAMTLVTNPLTIGFWLWLAYQVGTNLLGAPAMEPHAAVGGALGWLSRYGWPTLLGMGLFALGGAALGYCSVKLGWRLRIWLKRRARRAPLRCGA